MIAFVCAGARGPAGGSTITGLTKIAALHILPTIGVVLAASGCGGILDQPAARLTGNTQDEVLPAELLTSKNDRYLTLALTDEESGAVEQFDDPALRVNRTAYLGHTFLVEEDDSALVCYLVAFSDPLVVVISLLNIDNAKRAIDARRLPAAHLVAFGLAQRPPDGSDVRSTFDEEQEEDQPGDLARSIHAGVNLVGDLFRPVADLLLVDDVVDAFDSSIKRNQLLRAPLGRLFLPPDDADAIIALGMLPGDRDEPRSPFPPHEVVCRRAFHALKQASLLPQDR